MEIGVFGIVYVDDQVSWTDEDGLTRYGEVVALSDDAVWAEVRELAQDELVQLPTAILYIFH
jgi:hypothetical protein